MRLRAERSSRGGCSSWSSSSSGAGVFGGYVRLFPGVFARAAEGRLTLRESYQVCMAGLALTQAVRRGAPLVAPAFASVARGIQRLEAGARA